VRRDRQRKRNARRRDRAQATNRAGNPRVTLIDGHPVGAVGRFARAVRRMDNYIDHGLFLEREVERAETPAERERATAAVARQLAKVERYQRVLER
jgi:hypothetical protein